MFMSISVVPPSLFDRVRARMVTLSEACALLDKASTLSAIDEAQTLVINAAHTAAFNTSLLLVQMGGHYPTLKARLSDVAHALKAETLAYETYALTRPGDEESEILTALNRWKAARVEVVRVARQLTAVGVNPIDTEIDTEGMGYGA